MVAQPNQHPADVVQAETPSIAETWAQDTQHYLKILHDLAETGSDMVRIIHKRVRTQENEPELNTIILEDFLPFLPHLPPLFDQHSKFVKEAGITIELLSRSVRRTIMLAQKLATAPTTPSSKTPPPPPIPGNGEAQIHRQTANPDPDASNEPDSSDEPRSSDEPSSSDENERPDNNGAEMEHLDADRLDQSDWPDLDDEIAARPLANIIADIRRDLGLDAPPQSNHQSAPQNRTLPDVKIPADPAAPKAAKTALPNFGEAHPPPALRPAPSIPPQPFPRL